MARPLLPAPGLCPAWTLQGAPACGLQSRSREGEASGHHGRPPTIFRECASLCLLLIFWGGVWGKVWCFGFVLLISILLSFCFFFFSVFTFYFVALHIVLDPQSQLSPPHLHPPLKSNGLEY